MSINNAYGINIPNAHAPNIKKFLKYSNSIDSAQSSFFKFITCSLLTVQFILLSFDKCRASHTLCIKNLKGGNNIQKINVFIVVYSYPPDRGHRKIATNIIILK